MTDPPGAFVTADDHPLGWSPADSHFTYYGKRHFTIVKDGYETLQVDQDIPTPWYEYPPLDFISENLIPWRIIDVRRFNYALAPVQQPHTDALLRSADALRERGKAIQPPPGIIVPQPAPPIAQPLPPTQPVPGTVPVLPPGAVTTPPPGAIVVPPPGAGTVPPGTMPAPPAGAVTAPPPGAPPAAPVRPFSAN
jgi:hypothetical protein